MTSFNNKVAFTLAETLITLVIVGVVAALTVPNMIVNYQKEQTVTKLKRAYSSLNQALSSSIVKNGPTSSWDILDFTKYDQGGSQIFGEKYLFPHLQVKKDCKRETTGECTAYFTYGSVIDSTWSRFILNDNTIISYATYESGKTEYANFHIDVNRNLANKHTQRHIFFFKYYFDGNTNKNKLMPACYGKDRNYLLSKCKQSSGHEQCCAALIINDSWQIKDDYPW